jgi:hypothetical protein
MVFQAWRFAAWIHRRSSSVDTEVWSPLISDIRAVHGRRAARAGRLIL